MGGKISKELQRKILDTLEQGGVEVEGFEPVADNKLQYDLWVKGQVKISVLEINEGVPSLKFQIINKDGMSLWEFGPFTVEAGGTVTIAGVEIRMAAKLDI